MSSTIPIKRALISVYDKSGLVELATGLAQAGVEIVSTGSTARTIADAGVAVTEVATPGSPDSAASTSPGSSRTPRIFT